MLAFWAFTFPVVRLIIIPLRQVVDRVNQIPDLQKRWRSFFLKGSPFIPSEEKSSFSNPGNLSLDLKPSHHVIELLGQFRQIIRAEFDLVAIFGNLPGGAVYVGDGRTDITGDHCRFGDMFIHLVKTG